MTRHRTFRVLATKSETFSIDLAARHEAAAELSDNANADRARWAKKALQTFVRETGSSMGEEALHDLLCDLGHYAHSIGPDFRDEMERAADVTASEIAEEVQS
jgi:hypothetical protein